MPLQIIRADITTLNVDAIVCPTNRRLLPGSGIDRIVHKKAGRDFTRACLAMDEVKEGDAVYTDGFDLPCRYVIQTVGPHWIDGRHGEREILERAYRSSLLLSVGLGCESLAVPLVAAGYYGVPEVISLRIASDTISDFLSSHDLTVFLVVYNSSAFRISRELFSNVEQYIDENYIDEGMPENGLFRYSHLNAVSSEPDDREEIRSIKGRFLKAGSEHDEIKRRLDVLDEGFSAMLFRKIRESGMSEVECYRKANIDRKLFSKIRSDSSYSPSKGTALSLAIALHLPYDEIVELVSKAGYSLSPSNRRDVIVKYFIEKGIYDVLIINETLFAFDLVPLGYKK